MHGFDAGFFNVAGQDADWMDPQTRLLLQSFYAAAEDAGAADKAASDYEAALGYLKKAETALNLREYARARHEALLAKDKALEALQRSEAEQESHP